MPSEGGGGNPSVTKRPRPRARVRTDLRRSEGDVITEHLFTGRSDPLCKKEDIPQVGLVDLCSKYEQMEDIVNGKASWYNDIVHEKYRGGFQFPMVFHAEYGWRDGGPGPGGYPEQGNAVRWSLAPGVSSDYRMSALSACRAFPAPPAEVRDDLSAMAWDHITTAFPGQGSIAMFVQDLLNLAKGGLKKVLKLKTLMSKVEGRYRAKLRELAKQVDLGRMSEAESHWLAWNFAIKPMVGDIEKLLKSLSATAKRFNWLLRHNHKPVRVQYRRKDVQELYSYPTDLNFVALPPSWGHYFWQAPDSVGENVCEWVTQPFPHERCNYECDYRSGYTSDSLYTKTKRLSITYVVTAYVQFDIPDWVLGEVRNVTPWDFFGSLTGDLDSLRFRAAWFAGQGLLNPVSTTWDLIPFSFAIDWLVSYRTKLQEKKAEIPLFPPARVIEAAESWKVKHDVECGIYRYFDGSEFGVEEANGSAEYTWYSRQRGLVEYDVSPLRLPFTGWHYSIGSALLLQGRRRR